MSYLEKYLKNNIQEKYLSRIKYFLNLLRKTKRMLLGLAFSCYVHMPNTIVEKFRFFRALELRTFLTLENILSEKYCEIIFHENKKVFFKKPFFFNDRFPSKSQSIRLAQLVLKIQNAEIFGSSSIVLVEKFRSIYDIYALRNDSNYKYTDSAVIYVKKDKYLTKKMKAECIKKGILLSGNYSWNYYHLTVEIFSKLYYLKKMNIDRKIPLLVDDICKDVKNYNELLSLCNDDGRDVIYIKKGEKYKVDELYFSFAPSMIPPNFFEDQRIQDSDCVYDYDALKFMKEKMLSIKSKKEFPKKIFLSRGNASNRRAFNENEIFDTLKPYGFEKVYPENYGIKDQVAMFNGADAIAGGGGAAFTNILYCKKGCKILCFTNYNFPISVFSTIADFSGADMIYFYNNIYNTNTNKSLQDEYYINPCEVCSYLSKIYNFSIY